MVHTWTGVDQRKATETLEFSDRWSTGGPRFIGSGAVGGPHGPLLRVDQWTSTVEDRKTADFWGSRRFAGGPPKLRVKQLTNMAAIGADFLTMLGVPSRAVAS